VVEVQAGNDKKATEVVGHIGAPEAKKPRKIKEMIDMMEERRKWKHQSTEAAEKEYRRINNKLRRETDI